jgi:outer membrane protein OmpA-like peptidoglycan-associated protein
MGSRRSGCDSQGAARTVAACLAVLLLSSACATTPKKPPSAGSSDVIVLLPDDRGETGAVIVSGSRGERILTEPRESVAVAADAAPGESFILPKGDVRTLVGPALESLPKRPLTFVFYFKHDDTVLTRESLAEVRKAVRAIGKHGPVEISVVGHTDTVGTKCYNRRLGLERARAVADLFTDAGMDPSIIAIASHGEGNPLFPTGDEVLEPRNRRVELTVR